MMNSQLKTGVVLFLGAVVLAACGDKNSGSDAQLKDPKSVALTTISDTTSAAKAASRIFGADKIVSESSGEFDVILGVADGYLPNGVSLRQVGILDLPKIASIDAKAEKALALTRSVLSHPALRIATTKIRAGKEALAVTSLRAVTVDLPCDEGSMTVTADDVVEGNEEVLFKNCKTTESNGIYLLMNGKFKISTSITPNVTSGTMTFGDGDASIESGDLVMTMGNIADGKPLLVFTVSLTVTFSDTPGMPGSVVSVGMNGRLDVVDNTTNATSEVAFDNFSIETKKSGTPLSANMEVVTTLNGAVEAKHDLGATPLSPDSSQYLGFVNFAYGVLETSTGTSETINGKIVSELSPVECGHGSYQIVTTTPITRTKGKDLTGGVITINTNTTITANADGSIHVVVNGASADFADEKEMKNSLCL